jgi:archaellum component FlaC
MLKKMNPDKEKWLEYRTRISMGLGLEGEQTRWIFNKALDAIEHTENVKIEKKYDQSLEVIVGLSNDIQELKEIIADRTNDIIHQQKRIEQLEKGFKDILSWGNLGSTYSDISAAITFQDIARKTLAGVKGDKK